MATSRSKSGAYHHGDLRDELLRAAVEIAAERGLSNLSLRECARRAGVSHAAPYRHFADKQALLYAIAEQGDAWLAEAGRAAMTNVVEPRARLDAYGVAYVRFALEHPVHFRVMFTGQHEEPEVSPKDIPEDSAFGLLIRAAGAAIGRDGEAALVAGFASWCVPHGLAMLLLDGRIPADRVATPEQVDQLARTVLALWRDPDAVPG